MAYSKEKLKSKSHKGSLFSRPCWIGNASGKFLHMRTLLQVSFKHILIGVTSFIGTPHSMRMLYSTSLLTDLWTFSKSINNWWTAPLYSHFSSGIYDL
jgi:hypothetical protein